MNFEINKELEKTLNKKYKKKLPKCYKISLVQDDNENLIVQLVKKKSF